MPNIVLILLESISHDSSSFGRAGRDTTPFLQTLAGQGAEFVRTHVPVSQTGKAYWATLSGTTPEIFHDYSEALLVDEPYESLATVLRKVGYRSAFFEMSNGTFECAPAVFVNMGFDFGWWFENLEDPSAALGYLAGDDFRMIDPAMQWTQEKDQPFLLMMITSVAHDPFELPSWYGESTGDRFQDYLQAVRYTDDFVREVDARLQERGISDNTILCVLGDHGESFRADARRGRWVPYEEVVRIPWVLRWPGHVEAGRRIDWPCSQMDVTPTLLSLLGFDISRAGYDGRDALAPAEPDRRLYFSSWFDQSPLGFVEGHRKVVYWPYLDQVGEYDLADDPGELDLRLIEGETRDALIADMNRWRVDSRLFFDARRFRERVVFDHWHLFASGRSAWAYYEP
jgi:arylsulfatase A-like enzyme